MKRSSREKHSFIQFYFDDWKAGTAHMVRPVRSLYFDICLHNWDKRRGATQAELLLMVGDIDNWQNIVDALVEAGTLEADEQGRVFSPRAIREGERAFAAWLSKSQGGKKARGVMEESSNTDAAKLHQSSQESSTDSDSDSEPDSEPEKVRTPVFDPAPVVEAWNEMARRNGLAQVVKITEERGKRLKARIAEHGVEAIVAAIATVPEAPFLLGQSESAWKAHFDWLLQPKSCAKLIEGGYLPGTGKTSGWTQD